MKSLRRFGRGLATLAILGFAVAGCDTLTSPNLNFGDLDDLVTNPTPSSVNAAVQGLMVGHRIYIGVAPNDYLGQLGILGRESYNMDIADPRFESEMLRGLNPASAAFGGNFWGEPYSNIRLGDIILTAVEQLADGDYPEDKKAWVRGFTKTMNALDFLVLVNTRDVNCGCPITVPEGVEPAPAAGKEQVFDKVEELLSAAVSDLTSASGNPLFELSSGFLAGSSLTAAGFDTPATFTTFIRALQARVAVYRGEFAEALTFLSQSFLDTGADLRAGVYNVFGSGSGDRLNGYFEPGQSPNLRSHPSLGDDVEMKSDGVTPDDRFTAKTRQVDNRAYQGLCTDQSQFPVCDIGFDIYTTNTSAIPIIRNEELILLRAEANIGLNRLGDAQTDIDFIRATSGGLGPVSLMTQPQALDQLLYEKRFSLLFEGGHRWLDMRRYNKLDELPLDLPGHQVESAFPIPLEETTAGGGS